MQLRPAEMPSLINFCKEKLEIAKIVILWYNPLSGLLIWKSVRFFCRFFDFLQVSDYLSDGRFFKVALNYREVVYFIWFTKLSRRRPICYESASCLSGISGYVLGL